MIRITGATGSVGTELVKRLSGRGEKVRAFVRRGSHGGAIALRGAEVVAGDFREPCSFLPALKGIARLFPLMTAIG